MVREGVRGGGQEVEAEAAWLYFFTPTSQDDIAHARLYVILYLSPINGT